MSETPKRGRPPLSSRKSVTLTCRLTPEAKRRYNELACQKAAEFEGTPSDVLRELVLAFIEGRVTLTPRSF